MRRFVFWLITCCLPFCAWGANVDRSALLIQSDRSLSPTLTELLSLLDVPHDSTLNSVVEQTQKRWLQTGKERWQLDELYAEQYPKCFALLRDLGCVDALNAKSNTYDYALLFGGFAKRVQQRIDHLILQWNRGVRFKEIVFLTGERYLDPDVEADLLHLKTETAMLCFLWVQTPMPADLKNVPITLIDAPRQNDRRPNTQDTLVCWLQTNPKAGSCLAVSTQPMLGYQDAVARTILPSCFELETIGTAADEKMLFALYLDSLARWLYQIRRTDALLSP